MPISACLQLRHDREQLVRRSRRDRAPATRRCGSHGRRGSTCRRPRAGPRAEGSARRCPPRGSRTGRSRHIPNAAPRWRKRRGRSGTPSPISRSMNPVRTSLGSSIWHARRHQPVPQAMIAREGLGFEAPGHGQEIVPTREARGRRTSYGQGGFPRADPASARDVRSSIGELGRRSFRFDKLRARALTEAGGRQNQSRSHGQHRYASSSPRSTAPS